MGQNPSREAHIRAASQEIPCHVFNPKVCYCVQNSPPHPHTHTCTYSEPDESSKRLSNLLL